MPNKRDKQIAIDEKARQKEKTYLSRIVRAYVIFIIAVYPLYVTNEGYDNIVFRKAQMFWAVSIIFLIVFSIFYLVYILGQGKKQDIKDIVKDFNFADWALFAFMVFLTLSFIFSQYKSVAWLGANNRYDGYLTMLCMTLAYFPISRYYKPRNLDFTVFAISSSILCIIGFLQFYGYDFLNLFPYDREPYASPEGVPYFSGFSIVFRSTIGNMDFLSSYVCISILVFGVLFIKSKGWRQFLYLMAAIMNFVMMLIGDGDSAKVGISGALVLLIPYWMYKRQSLGKVMLLCGGFSAAYYAHHWFMINEIMPEWDESSPIRDLWMRDKYSHLPLEPILIISVVTLAIGAMLIMIKQSIWLKEKSAKILGCLVLAVVIICGFSGVQVIGKKPEATFIYEAREVLHGNLDDSFGSHRIFIWRRALDRVQGQPVFGTGPDTFYHAFGKINQAEAREKLAVVYDKAHNDFIQILLCSGVPTFLAYIAFIMSVLAAAIKKSFDDTFALMALGAVVSYLLQSFFGIDTIIVTPIYWAILAIARGNPAGGEPQKNA